MGKPGPLVGETIRHYRREILKFGDQLIDDGLYYEARLLSDILAEMAHDLADACFYAEIQSERQRNE